MQRALAAAEIDGPLSVEVIHRLVDAGPTDGDLTIAEAADALGVELGQIVKSIAELIGML